MKFTSMREHIGYVTKRAIVSKKYLSAGSPEVGIFWIYNGTVIPIGYPWKVGEDFGDFIISKDDHFKSWNDMKRTGSLKYFGIPQNKQEDYDSIPRGRIGFDKKKKVFVVYHGDQFSEKDKVLIRQEFKLPIEKTVFEEDDHYMMSDVELYEDDYDEEFLKDLDVYDIDDDDPWN